MTNSSAGAGRDGKLRAAMERVSYRYFENWSYYEHSDLGEAIRDLAVVVAAILAVPDPLASDTGQGQCSACGAPTLKPGERHAKMLPTTTRPEFFAEPDDTAPLASSSAPQGEQKNETTTI